MANEIQSEVAEPRERRRKYPMGAADTATLQYQRAHKVAKLTFPTGVGNAPNAFLFAWKNPESNKIVIHEVIIRITTTGGTGASVLNVDVVAGATDTGDTIFDGLDLNATGVYSSHNVSDSGTNGNEKPHVMDEAGGANDYLTGKILVAKCDNLVGAAYVFYTEV